MFCISCASLKELHFSNYGNNHQYSLNSRGLQTEAEYDRDSVPLLDGGCVMSIIISLSPSSELLIALVVKSLALEGLYSFFSAKAGGRVGRGHVWMEAEHPTLSHRVKSSEVRLKSSSGEERVTERRARSVSSWNLCETNRNKRT